MLCRNVSKILPVYTESHPSNSNVHSHRCNKNKFPLTTFLPKIHKKLKRKNYFLPLKAKYVDAGPCNVYNDTIYLIQRGSFPLYGRQLSDSWQRILLRAAVSGTLCCLVCPTVLRCTISYLHGTARLDSTSPSCFTIDVSTAFIEPHRTSLKTYHSKSFLTGLIMEDMHFSFCVVKGPAADATDAPQP
jgi:hypothetical protein